MYRPRNLDGPFGALVRSIIYQQLAGRAAQADDDREVRHSASFAAEVIRGNLRR